MCGINGLIKLNKIFDCGDIKELVHQMNEQIIHRGPNSEGLFADDFCSLGMRRLSIIYLTDGNQPIWNEKRDKLIVFNGELYNFISLRADLKIKGHHFYTNSDTEVVLHGYEEYGTNFFEKMEGMYAFCIYDLNQKEWILCRDRIGEKPLYYFQTKDFFLFGSELKSLLKTGLVPKIINKEAMSIYFQLTYIPAPYSIFENVYKLPPASYLRINANGDINIEKYWKLTLTQDERYQDYEWCKKQLRETFLQSVENRMVSDVPLGAFLSGGFDSTIVVGAMSQLSSTPINTFTIGFKEKQHDESALAELVAKKNNTNHRILSLDWDEAVGNIDRILENMDEPFADSSLIATYTVSKMAKEYVSVILTGDAGDELFAGYNKYLISYYSERYNRIPKILRKGIIEPSSKLLPAGSAIARKVNKVIGSANMDIFDQRKYLMSLGFKHDELSQLMKSGYVSEMPFIREQYAALNCEEQTRAQFVDLNTVLEGDMLTKVDRGSMLASLETRVPMLDRKLIELAFNMPAKFKINNKDRKIILKDTFRDLIPEELFSAPKHGFSVPVGNWLENDLKTQLMKYANKDFLDEQGLFNTSYVHQIIEEHMTHKVNRFSELWAFYAFQGWYFRVLKATDG